MMTKTQTWRTRPISRRGLLRLAGGGAVAGAGIAVVGCGDGGDDRGLAVASPTAPGVIGPVEQQKQRRIRTGVTGWNTSQAFDGLTLLAPIRGSSAYLVDMEGEVAHQWDLSEYLDDGAGVWFVDLLDNGNLFVVVYSPAGDGPTFLFKGGLMLEVDLEGRAVWQFRDDDQHHDARLLANGNLLLLRTERTPPDLAAQVQGGLPVDDSDGMWVDWVAESTLDGEVVWEWHAWEHLDTEVDRIDVHSGRDEWTHGNSVQQMADGNILISFRHTNTVAVVNRESGAITRRLAAPLVAQQHHASELPDGNVLIFDNGAHRLDGSIPFSRVIEVDPATSEIAWEYRDPFLLNFFSPFISSAQRLPNGNTFITEGNFGRLFEVTEAGELVWEYISPHFEIDPILGENNAIFRAFRYARDRVPGL